MDTKDFVRRRRQFMRMLEAGMALTVEPGIYIRPGGGTRIEDDVLVTRRAAA